MDTFTLDFDLEGKGYIVVVKPHAADGHAYDAQLDEDTTLHFLRAEDGSLVPVSATGTDPKLVNAVATRILERVHANARRNNDTPSLP